MYRQTTQTEITALPKIVYFQGGGNNTGLHISWRGLSAKGKGKIETYEQLSYTQIYKKNTLS